MAKKDDSFLRLSGVPQQYFDKLSEDMPDGDPDALKVFLAVRTAARRIDHTVGRWLDRRDLTVTKLDVLHLVRSFPGSTVTEMSRSLRLTQPNLTFVVNALERDGLVIREPSPSNRRNTAVRISEAGEAVVADITPRHFRAISRALLTIDIRDRIHLIKTLARLTEFFEAVEFEENAPAT